MFDTFSRSLGQQLHWVQPKAMERNYELRTEDRVVGALAFPKAFGSLAAAATVEGDWSFKRAGFFKPFITVRQEGGDTDVAVYRPKWTGMQGTLEFADGNVFLWSTANFWATRFQFSDASGQPLVTYQSGLEEWKLSDLFKSQGRVEIDPSAYALRELPLLVLLGWYIILLHEQDSAAAASAAAAS
jgi:hypothetical protein